MPPRGQRTSALGPGSPLPESAPETVGSPLPISAPGLRPLQARNAAALLPTLVADAKLEGKLGHSEKVPAAVLE